MQKAEWEIDETSRRWNYSRSRDVDEVRVREMARI